ncbi:MAG: NIPSNAP family protein [Betaproteobacteria bacterium]|nr:NIPSNAP family protein [Betaproteobacteria bacterium]
MIVEERMYTLHVGKVPEFMEVYEREGLPILKRHLGDLFGFFVNEVGPQNLIMHLWAYESFEEREKRRAALAADPARPAYRAKNQPRIQSQETRIMRPPAFFERVLRAMLKAARS